MPNLNDNGENVQGTSNTPMILGIVAGVLMIPAFLFLLLLYGANTAMGGKSGVAGVFAMAVAFTPIITGIMAGLKAKTDTKKSFKLFVISSALSGFSLLQHMFLSLPIWGAFICFIIGAILVKNQTKNS